MIIRGLIPKEVQMLRKRGAQGCRSKPGYKWLRGAGTMLACVIKVKSVGTNKVDTPVTNKVCPTRQRVSSKN